MLCSDDAAATYTISDIALEYDVIINAVYMEKESTAQQKISYPYTRVNNKTILPTTVEERYYLVARY